MRVVAARAVGAIGAVCVFWDGRHVVRCGSLRLSLPAQYQPTNQPNPNTAAHNNLPLQRVLAGLARQLAPVLPDQVPLPHRVRHQAGARDDEGRELLGGW